MALVSSAAFIDYIRTMNFQIIIQVYTLSIMYSLILGPPLFKRSVKGYTQGAMLAVVFMTNIFMAVLITVLWVSLLLHCRFSVKSIYRFLENKYGN